MLQEHEKNTTLYSKYRRKNAQILQQLVRKRSPPLCCHRSGKVRVWRNKLYKPHTTLQGTGLEPFHDHYILIFNTSKNPLKHYMQCNRDSRSPAPLIRLMIGKYF